MIKVLFVCHGNICRSPMAEMIFKHLVSEIDEKEAMKAAKKMTKGTFDLEDFLSTMKQVKKLGPLEKLIKI